MNRLQNKIAVITGGNSGIGLATAREFLKEGARVIITGRSQGSVDAALKELGTGAQGLVTDVGDMTQLRRLREQASALTDKVDVLFVNAGIGKFAPIDTVDEAHFDEQFNINVKGAYFSIQQLLPLIPAGGSIILNTSINAHIGMANASVYSATKGAVVTLARTLSSELLSRGIRVNAISPGPIATPIFSKMGLTDEQVAATASHIQGQIPLNRFGAPEEIARIATFFASDDSSFVLGAELIADGGMATL